MVLPTRPMRFGGEVLRLNFATSAAGWLVCECVDAGTGAALAGYSRQDMAPQFGDELDRPVVWAQGCDLGALVGRPVRLRFVFHNADL